MSSKAAQTCRSDIHTSEIIYELQQDTVGKINSKDGTFRFAAYGCALLERQTPSGMYVYTAANYETGKTEILSRRKRQLDLAGFEAMAAKISASSVCGDARLNSDKKPGESVTVNAARYTEAWRFYKTLCVIPDMLVKNKQGFGRTIRTERDTAVIAMLDYRLREGAPYRGVLPFSVAKSDSVLSEFSAR